MTTMTNSKTPVRMLAEAGIMIALAQALSLVTVFRMPQGGSITAGSMIPIMIFAMRWGLGPGVLAGGAFGLLQMIFGGYVVHPAQAALDYPLAFAALGLAGMAKPMLKGIANEGLGKSAMAVAGAVLVAVGLRFVCHLLSGVIFFSEYAGEVNPWLYSAIYNGSFLSVEFLISAIVLSLVIKPVVGAFRD